MGLSLKSHSFSVCDQLIQTFVTSKVVEYQIVQNAPSFLPLRAKEAVISRKKRVTITSTASVFVKQWHEHPEPLDKNQPRICASLDTFSFLFQVSLLQNVDNLLSCHWRDVPKV